MRPAALLPFVALATAIVIPSAEVLREVRFPSSQLSKEVASVSSTSPDIFDSLNESIDDGGSEAEDHEPLDMTIYEAISRSDRTKKFVELVNKHDSLVDLLNSTEAGNRTLFVPIDDAFEHIPDGAKKPSDDFIKDLLTYHIVAGHYADHKLLHARTLPTELHERFLGGEAQRLRVRATLTSVNVNFYSWIVKANIPVRNGVIHAVNRILAPPPMVGRELSLLPAEFSTLLLAYEKTDFVKFIHGQKMEGSTVFAPNNRAFKRLGPGANAFLFNTDKGRRYLRALLKYQIVANATLYSDAFYRGGDGDEDGVNAEGHQHVDLPTLLSDNAVVSVDIKRFAGFVRMVVNGKVHVVVQDAIAKNGVMQVVNTLPIPPHKHHKGTSWEQDYGDGDMEVDELMARLEPYLETEEDPQELWEDL